MTQIKICGLARYQDAEYSHKLGVHYLGMVFHPKSKRMCSLNEAKKIIIGLPDAKKVFVFGHDPKHYIIDIVSKLNEKNSNLQIPSEHESFAELTDCFSPKNIFVSVAVHRRISDADLSPYQNFAGIILDTGGKKDEYGNLMSGGTGVSFNWEYAKDLKTKVFLAGGISSKNVDQAIKIVRPFGIDASSSLEKAPGVKDHKRLSALVKKILTT